jgi:acetyl esterase/lipase
MGEVEVRQEIVYRRADSSDLTFDLYLPPGRRGPAPPVYLVHGPVPEGVRPKDWALYRGYGRALAASGLAGIAFTHRFNRRRDYHRGSEDVAAMLACVRSRGQELGVRHDVAGVWSFSGGAPVCGFVLRGKAPEVRCVAYFYSVLDLSAMPAREGADSLPRAEIAAFSPARLLKIEPGPLPKFFLARAGRDTAAINASQDAFVAAALARNVDLELRALPDARHGFDLLDDTDETRSAIGAALAFFSRNLPGAAT